LHDHNIAHLDLKPTNLIVDKRLYELYIINFGLTVELNSLDCIIKGYCGTKGYVAPEVDDEKYYNLFLVDM
jgi:serine/threonine protein kinase